MLKCTHRGSIPFVIRILVIPVVIRHSSFKSMSRIDRAVLLAAGRGIPMH